MDDDALFSRDVEDDLALRTNDTDADAVNEANQTKLQVNTNIAEKAKHQSSKSNKANVRQKPRQKRAQIKDSGEFAERRGKGVYKFCFCRRAN